MLETFCARVQVANMICTPWEKGVNAALYIEIETSLFLVTRYVQVDGQYTHPHARVQSHTFTVMLVL